MERYAVDVPVKTHIWEPQKRFWHASYGALFSSIDELYNQGG